MNSRLNNIFVGIVVMGFGACGLGCYAETGSYAASDHAAVYEASPPLVAVEPGVWVVSNQPTTIYFVDDSYWTARGNTWYRSSAWNRGWASIDVSFVPSAIVDRQDTRFGYSDAPRNMAMRPLPPGDQVFPGVRSGQTNIDPRVRHNEMGSAFSGNERVGQYQQDQRGHERDR